MGEIFIFQAVFGQFLQKDSAYNGQKFMGSLETHANFIPILVKNDNHTKSGFMNKPKKSCQE